MIVIIDTNAFHGDVHLRGGAVSATLSHAAEADAFEVWVPRGVVEELVRQYPERLAKLNKVVGKIKRDLDALGFERPAIPADVDAATVAYRAALESRLAGAGCRVADHPGAVGKVIEWAAQRRHPVKVKVPDSAPGLSADALLLAKTQPQPVVGVVDSAIWLTVVEAALLDEVAFVSANASDFADPQDRTRLHPLLCADLQAAGADAGRVERFESLTDLNQRYVRQPDETLAAAEAFLADNGKASALRSEIEDAVEWFEVEMDDTWQLGVEIDSSTMNSFAADDLELMRADRGPSRGFYMTIRANGLATFDLGIRKYEASAIQDNSPIRVLDWDWNESMVLAEVELMAEMIVEVLVTPQGDAWVSIDDVTSPN